ncbi:MAG TPA: DUF456 domain-containing protein [Chloroflexi bacterium]|nr:MAG: hypothetical protein DRI46_08170 [Chloroflexota bacterium]HDD54621.1 DUF456 domain-containing protein [Chloroflexota bacterium]
MPNWLNLSLNILIYLIMAVGLLGMIVPIYPGVVIIWAAVLIHGLATGFAVLEIWVLVVITILMIAGTLVDNFLMGGKARQAGASWLSIWGALLAGLVGTFAFPPLGGIVAAPTSLFLLEYARLRNSQEAWAVTKGLLTGWGLSFIARFFIGLVMIIVWAIWGVR